MSDTEELVQKIQRLSINQQSLVKELVEELVSKGSKSRTAHHRGSDIAPNSGVRLLPRTEQKRFKSRNEVYLAVGDRVEILNTRSVGREGDVAEVVQFNKAYVAVRILSSGKVAQRSGKYLSFLE